MWWLTDGNNGMIAIINIITMMKIINCVITGKSGLMLAVALIIVGDVGGGWWLAMAIVVVMMANVVASGCE